MTNYGDRFMTISEFQSYCGELKIKSTPDNRKMEFLEEEGILLPVARIIKPEEYILKRRQTDLKDETFGQGLPEWEDLERLLYDNNDVNMWHLFDWEFDQKNEFLLRPQVGDFRPWGSFKVKVENVTGDKYDVSTIENYYHYWQAYLLDELQSEYPVFTEYNWLLQNLKSEVEEKASYLKPDITNPIYKIGGYYDALSFFIGLYTNEEQRTFDTVSEINGFKQLNDEQSTHYQEQLKGHANFVLQRFNIHPQELYQFLINVLRRQANYLKNERLKLAEALGNDAIFITRLIFWATGQPVDEIEKEIGKQAGYWVQQQFRHLDKALEVYDYAQETYKRLAAKYNQAFAGFEISSSETEELVKFFEDKGLFIIPFAIFDIDDVLNNHNRFRFISLYTGLKNLTTGFECFLKEIANLVNLNPGRKVRTNKLFYTIQDLFINDWGKAFVREYEVRKYPIRLDDIDFIEDVYDSPGLDNILKAFLIAHEARNFIAHEYTNNPNFYHHWYSITYSEICYSFFYTWRYALQKGWIHP